jgi:hypothetical protein
MRHALALIFACCALGAQVEPDSPTEFQHVINPNDERLKFFLGLKEKAEAGDTDALEILGDYYSKGMFPVKLDIEKAKAAWTKGASLGSHMAAQSMHRSFPQNLTDTEDVIERSKWLIITFVLSKIRYEQHDKSQWSALYPAGDPGVSDSSFAEAKSRAASFLADVKISNPSFNPPAKITRGRMEKVPALSFVSLSQFDAHRKNVCSAYMKAALPIYNKGETVSEEEKAAFISTAAELARLQSYIGKARRLSLSSKSNAALRAVNSEKMRECYSKMASAKIATALPVTRAELNEASIYINALGQLMQLPVSMGE